MYVLCDRISVQAAAAGVPDKYITAHNQIRMGQPADATHGIQVLMGLTDLALGQHLHDPVGAIRKDFAQSGGADDKDNLRCVLGGIQGQWDWIPPEMGAAAPKL